MSRAKWKGPVLDLKILSLNKKKKEIFTKSRHVNIIPKFVGLTINVYNGKVYTKVKISEDMVGYKLGEFSPTRKKFTFKKKK